MARMRYIKPGFWTDGKIVRLSPFARLLYIGCWNFALCDTGHLPDDPFELKLQILPADDVDAHELVEELVSAGRLHRISVGGRSYLLAHRLPDHQKTDKRWEARCPACAAEQDAAAAPPQNAPPPAESPAASHDPSGPPPDSPSLSETLPPSPQEGIGGEGKGEVLALAAGEREPKPRKARAPDPTWDAVTAVCRVDTASMTDRARSAVNGAVADIRKTGAGPAEIHRRGELFRKHWPDVTLTPSALARRWSEVAQPPPTPRGRITEPAMNDRLWQQTRRGAAS